ncbi:MAG TPA: (deoxy)nucleoside triphosphate pyrophosphohydrolase [Sporichthyaceae bacterium]|nr:(deoxy)nucleoside triphosphate pyrophosphohydrolase [Sporichthyaceae bacterium]
MRPTEIGRASGYRVVVGAAIVRDGRVLAARRRRPEPLAGGWEFPGGKVDAGEAETAAVVRECAEELGVRVACGARLPGEWQISASLVLRVFLAEIVSGELRLGPDHDEVRWLSGAELFDVDWLPADLPAAVFLAELLPAG